MADETDRFLRSLYEHARRAGEDPEEVAERIYQNARGVSRRELLGGAGALGLGAAMGGGGAMAATGTASADASTSDSDGNVGTPSDPVDVFAEGIDSNSVNTEKQYDASDILAISGSGALISRYSLDNAQTAIDDASAAGGGYVKLPAGVVAGPLTMRTGVVVKGRGSNGGVVGPESPTTEINTSTDDSNSVINVPSGAQGWGLGHVTLTGTGVSGTNTTAFDFPAYTDDGPFNYHINDLAIGNWRGEAISGNLGFQSVWGHVNIGNVDAGDVNGLINIDGLGPGNSIAGITSYPDSGGSGSGSVVLNSTSNTFGHLEIGWMTVGRAPGVNGITLNGDHILRLGYYNLEPTVSPSSSFAMIQIQEIQALEVGVMVANNAGNAFDYNHAINVNEQTGTVELHRVSENNGASLNSHIRASASDRTAPTIYHGFSSELNNSTGSTLTNPMVALGDLATVS